MIFRPRHLCAAALLFSAACAHADRPAADDWPRYARDFAATRYSPLKQINRANVSQLELAWSFRVMPNGGGAIASSATPIVIDNVLYYPAGDSVVALKADTGEEIWRHRISGGIARRSVSWWPGDETYASRIFYSTGKKIVALLADSGAIDESFGVNGAIALDVPYNSPPFVYEDLLIVGANTAEMQRGDPGDVRAFDARTGAKRWTFHTVPRPGEPGHETWLDDGWRDRSGVNVWIWYLAADEKTDTIYLPIGGPAANYWGGDRPGDNLFGNTLVAVDAQTGALKWHFQTIHHDLWDSDLPAPPVLLDIQTGARKVRALAETGKSAFMYILDRDTGEPVFGVEERPVAAADVPGEWYSPTQPFPVKPPRLSRSHWTPDDVVTADDTSADHAAACRALLDRYGGTFFNAGAFTPFFLYEEGKPVKASINMPMNGGANWGGAAADPDTGLIFINTSEGGSIGFVEKRKEGADYGRGTQGSVQPYDRASLDGPGAYSSFSADLTDDNGDKIKLPCIRPPWGRLFAIDANTGDIVWETRLGITEALPKERQETGTLNTFGGPIATAGGLVFIGATNDRRFRAFDAANGEELWTYKLDYSAQAVPITYRGGDGRQYVAVTAANFGPGPRGPDGKPLNNESLMVFALPKELEE